MSSQEALDLVARYDRLLDRYEREAIALTDEALIRAFQQLERQLRQSYSILQDTPVIQRQAMIARQLGQFLDITRNTNDYQAAFNQLIADASKAGGNSTADLVGLYDGEMSAQIAAFADVPIEAIAAQVQGATERLASHGADFARKSSALIETNLALGQAVATTTRQLRQQLGVTRGQAETIARTETIGAFDSAAQQRYDEAGLYSQVFSVGDRRVCQFCAYRNGRVYKTADIKLPWHPLDRCFRSPYSKEWAKLGLIDEEFVNQYAADGLEQLKATGKQPDSGLAPFERVNGRAKPPVPVWSPTLPRLGTITSLPENHAVSLNPRIRQDSFDNALDAIQSKSASERVALFRDFVTNQDIQTFVYDQSRNEEEQVRFGVDRIRRGSRRISDSGYRETFRPLEGANGYTGPALRHVWISTNSLFDDSPFKIESGLLSTVARTLFNKPGNYFSVSSIPLRIAARRPNIDPTNALDTQNFITYLHEMGHQVHFAVNRPSPPSEVLGSITRYGAKDDMEWFAEHFTLWMLDAERYAKVDPNGAAFVERTVRNAVSRQRRFE